jgi:hypothetical protein
MWTPAERRLVGDYGAGQVLSDEQYGLIEPLIIPLRQACFDRLSMRCRVEK